MSSTGSRLSALSCLPIRHLHDVVPRSRLLLGRDRQEILVTLRGDVVDADVDPLLGRPFIAQLGQRIISAWDPMVPETDAQLAGGVGAAHVGGCHQLPGYEGSL